MNPGLLSTLRHTYDSHAALKAAVAQYLEEGWQRCAADDPAQGIVGELLTRSEGEVEESRWLVWKPFGDLLVEEYLVRRDDDIAELLNNLASTKTLYRADDPRARQLGFVYYENGAAHLTRIPLTYIKTAGTLQVAGKPFPEWRDSLQTPRDTHGPIGV